MDPNESNWRRRGRAYWRERRTADRDEFHQQLLGVAYKHLRQKPKVIIGEITPDKLLAESFHAWIDYRNEYIEAQGRRTMAAVPRPKLLALLDMVDERLWERGHGDWEWPGGDDETTAAWFVAYGLAILRWHHNEDAGRGPVWALGEADAAAYLAFFWPVQAQLF